MKNSYKENIFNDFNLSIVLPFYKKYLDFAKILPLNSKYLQRNGIEVILILDEPSQIDQVLELVNIYPLINWIVVSSLLDHKWSNQAKAINAGIRSATKKYIMVCNPESQFKTDVIFKLRYMLEMYTDIFAVGKVYFDSYGEKNAYKEDPGLFYGSIMVEKTSLLNVGCYTEELDGWRCEEDNVRAKLEYAGLRKMFVDDAILIHGEHTVGGWYTQGRNKSKEILAMANINSLLPKNTDFNTKWACNFEKIIFDYRFKPNAYELSSNYIKDSKI